MQWNITDEESKEFLDMIDIDYDPLILLGDIGTVSAALLMTKTLTADDMRVLMGKLTGKSYAEIANDMGRKPNWAEVTHKNTLAKIRSCPEAVEIIKLGFVRWIETEVNRRVEKRLAEMREQSKLLSCGSKSFHILDLSERATRLLSEWFSDVGIQNATIMDVIELMRSGEYRQIKGFGKRTEFEVRSKLKEIDPHILDTI